MSTSGSIPPVSTLTTPPDPSTQLPGSSNTTLGANAFLQLLTTELQNQDPTQPSDPTQSITQLAQFSALQYQQQLSNAFTNFQSNFGVLQTASLVGKQVTVEETSSSSSGNSSTVTGTVASVDVENGSPYITLTGSNGKPVVDGNGNPILFAVTQIVGIGGAPPTTSSGGTGS